MNFNKLYVIYIIFAVFIIYVMDLYFLTKKNVHGLLLTSKKQVTKLHTWLIK